MNDIIQFLGIAFSISLAIVFAMYASKRGEFIAKYSQKPSAPIPVYNNYVSSEPDNISAVIEPAKPATPPAFNPRPNAPKPNVTPPTPPPFFNKM